MKNIKISLDHQICKKCGICVELCNRGALRKQKNGLPSIDIDKCIGCRMCELICPDFALRVEVQ